jgi:hypothetical protein
METTTVRYEEFGSAPWVGVVLALLVGLALVGPLRHGHPSAAHVAPSAPAIHNTMR